MKIKSTKNNNTPLCFDPGDVVGEGFFRSHLDAGALFGIRAGNGDHYIFDLAVNMYWLQFLDQTNQLEERTRRAALAGMNQGTTPSERLTSHN